MKYADKANPYRQKNECLTEDVGVGMENDSQWVQTVSFGGENILELHIGDGCTTLIILRTMDYTLHKGEFCNR